MQQTEISSMAAAQVAMDQSSFPGVFPVELAAALRQAAETPITARDPLARQKAIDRVIERGRIMFPEWFR